MTGAPDFETWVMRGLVILLGGIVVRIGFQRWRTQDEREQAFRDALEKHRAETAASFKEFRQEFLSHLDQLRQTTETSLRELNSTVAELAGTAGEIRARMAERYATKEDLEALEKRVQERFRLCQRGACAIPEE